MNYIKKLCLFLFIMMACNRLAAVTEEICKETSPGMVAYMRYRGVLRIEAVKMVHGKITYTRLLEHANGFWYEDPKTPYIKPDELQTKFDQLQSLWNSVH